MTTRPYAGFSLVELSIVLVIIGLLAGGVLGGRSLIRAAELRTIPSDYQKYQSALFTFRMKYHNTPGDMPNATSFWGARAVCNSNITGEASGVCNGNGNGKMVEKVANPCTSNAISYITLEGWQFWAHLSKANIIEGSYTGAGDANGTWVGGVNVPQARAGSDLVWSTAHTGCMPQYWTGDWAAGGQALFLGKGGNVANTPTVSPDLPPEDLWSIDQKIDDGKPGTGIMQVVHSTLFGLNCALGTPENFSEAVYNVQPSDRKLSCRAFFYLN